MDYVVDAASFFCREAYCNLDGISLRSLASKCQGRPASRHFLQRWAISPLQNLRSSQFYSMAYPFPRFASAPQTPLHARHAPKRDLESSPMARPSNTIAASRRTGLAVFLVLAVFLWMINPFSGPPTQIDRIPFSNNVVDE